MKKSQENPSENSKSNDYFSNIMRSLSSKGNFLILPRQIR